MNLKMLFGILILYVLFVIYTVHSWGQSPSSVKVKVTPRSAHQAPTEEMEVVSTSTNKDGTYSIFISACGSMIELVVPREMILERRTAPLEKAAKKAVDAACKSY